MDPSYTNKSFVHRDYARLYEEHQIAGYFERGKGVNTRTKATGDPGINAFEEGVNDPRHNAELVEHFRPLRYIRRIRCSGEQGWSANERCYCLQYTVNPTAHGITYKPVGPDCTSFGSLGIVFCEDSGLSAIAVEARSPHDSWED